MEMKLDDWGVSFWQATLNVDGRVAIVLHLIKGRSVRSS